MWSARATLLIALAAAFGSTQAVAQTLAPDQSALLMRHGIPLPSAKAITLAQAVAGIDAVANSRAAERQAVESTLDELFRTYRGDGRTPCARSVAQCEQEARRIASAHVQQIYGQREALLATLRAVLIDEIMSDVEVEQAMEFVSTPAGRALVAALARPNTNMLAGPLAEKLNQVLADPERGRESAAAREQMFDAFYSKTAGLPRAPLPNAPPPPTMPRRSPSPATPMSKGQ